MNTELQYVLEYSSVVLAWGWVRVRRVFFLVLSFFISPSFFFPSSMFWLCLVFEIVGDQVLFRAYFASWTTTPTPSVV